MDLKKLTDGELDVLRKDLTRELKRRHDERQLRASSAFQPGDIVWFYAKHRAVTIRLERVNEKTLVGCEVDRPECRWRVAPTLCTKRVA